MPRNLVPATLEPKISIRAQNDFPRSASSAVRCSLEAALCCINISACHLTLIYLGAVSVTFPPRPPYFVLHNQSDLDSDLRSSTLQSFLRRPS